MPDREPRTVSSVIRRWPLILLSVVLVVTTLVIAVNVMPPTYSSTVRVLYGDSSSQLLTGASTASSDVQRTLATQADLVTGDAVMRSAANDLSMKADDLIAATTVEDLPGSNVFTISVTGPTAVQAAQRAQQVAQWYVDSVSGQTRSDVTQQASSLQSSIDDLRRQLAASPAASAESTAISTALSDLVQQLVQLSSAADSEQGLVRIIASARVPAAPSSPTTVTAGLLGIVVGSLLGVGLALALGESGHDRLVARLRRPRRRSALDDAGDGDDDERPREAASGTKRGRWPEDRHQRTGAVIGDGE